MPPPAQQAVTCAGACGQSPGTCQAKLPEWQATLTLWHTAAAFAKPENALKRAEELIAVGQTHAALQALHDVITSKRHRTWQKVLETIMFKYVDLCVELKKGRYAKDGLIHYRNVCQQVNVASLEEVIKYFIKTATGCAEAATASAEVGEGYVAQVASGMAASGVEGTAPMQAHTAFWLPHRVMSHDGALTVRLSCNMCRRRSWT